MLLYNNITSMPKYLSLTSTVYGGNIKINFNSLSFLSKNYSYKEKRLKSIVKLVYVPLCTHYYWYLYYTCIKIVCIYNIYSNYNLIIKLFKFIVIKFYKCINVLAW